MSYNLLITKEKKQVLIERKTLLSRFTQQGAEKGRTSVIMEYASGDSFVLCNLLSGLCESVESNILLQPGERFFLFSTNNDVLLSAEQGEEEEYVVSDAPLSLSAIRIKENERIIITGQLFYSTVNLISCTTNRVSLCAVAEEEVTLCNLVPNRIERADISLELSDTQQLEVFLVGQGEVEIIGNVIVEEPFPNYSSEEEHSNEDSLEEECSNEHSNEEEQNSDQSASTRKKRVSFNLSEEEAHEEKKTQKDKKPVSKEKQKQLKKEEDRKEIKITEMFKGTGRAEVRKNDKIKIKYAIFIGEKLVEKTSYKGIAITLGAGQTIKGLEVGLEGMKIGAKRSITIPPHLAYGSQRVGNIPPNSTVTFRVEVFDILKTQGKDKGKEKDPKKKEKDLQKENKSKNNK
ncbi:hypothetical protein NEFER03_1650 [Nematocida sp. LUAm3]|nr:hypothetical protein NEFER03_1650 [Nematocida sp. LUAm3]KAI5174674.1 hypothetical protein NEFER02_0784 [Nematocida sp. LUAm2]KAI5177916.1 hypothetical protein NEFER01_1118 [Nematocida sp. LUAm1]